MNPLTSGKNFLSSLSSFISNMSLSEKVNTPSGKRQTDIKLTTNCVFSLLRKSILSVYSLIAESRSILRGSL